MMYLMSSLISLVGVLLGVAFFTLMERKIMGIAHFRKGPNKVIMKGISQPISDAIKLLTKEIYKMSFLKVMMFTLGPSLCMLLMILCWSCYEPSHLSMSKSSMTILLIVAIMSLMPFTFILMGWGSNSKFSLMGCIRAIAQVVSYEVCMILFILSIIYICGAFSPKVIWMVQTNMWLGFINLPLLLTWFVVCLAESNRTPFDHAESESELVSGFNVEYSGGLFALIFISEYGMLMFISFFTSLMFLGGSGMLIKTMGVCFLMVVARCSFPRVRYDKLMMLAWKKLLPYSISLMGFSLL